MEIKNNFEKTIFLLGGHDLEMLEISKLLSSKGILFYDEDLQWDNATLSKYKDKLNNTDYFVGIELVADIAPPLYYLLIDHHNENSEKPSAIEQVAEFLGIPLTRDQQLIAANDKGYIPAMIAMGATKEEIADIRKRDRKAQGVTEEDERLGQLSIRENLTFENGIAIVKSSSSKFSPIIDRLFPTSKILIYSNVAFTYYGQHIKEIVQLFRPLVEEHKAYYGGGGNGYFGIANNSLSYEELQQSKDKLISTINNLTI